MKLYKYKKFGKRTEEELENFIEGNCFHSYAKNFHDKNDVNLDMILGNKKQIQHNILNSEKYLGRISIESFRRLSIADNEEYEKFLTDLLNDFKKQYNEEFPICCLTTKSNSKLMWNSHANQEEGYLIEFDVDVGKNMRMNDGLYRVVYVKKLSKTKVTFGTDPKYSLDCTKSIFCHKLVEYKYENEYRIIRLRNCNETYYNVGKFSKILLGKNISSKNRSLVNDVLINNNLQDLIFEHNHYIENN